APTSVVPADSGEPPREECGVRPRTRPSLASEGIGTMDLAVDYLAHSTHERNVAAAERINAYRRRVAERRALEAMSGENTSPDRTSTQSVDSTWSRALRAPAGSRSHGHDAALPGRP